MDEIIVAFGRKKKDMDLQSLERKERNERKKATNKWNGVYLTYISTKSINLNTVLGVNDL